MLGLIPVVTEHSVRFARHDLVGRQVLVVSDGDGLADEVLTRLAGSGARVEALTVRELAPPHGTRYQGTVVDAEGLARRLAEGPVPDWVLFLPPYTALARAGRPLNAPDGLYAAGLVRTLFHTLSPLGRRWVARGAGGFAVVSKSDGRFGLSGARTVDPLAGTVHGMARALHSEVPVIRTILLDAAPSVPAGTVADRLLDLVSDGERGHVEVGLAGQGSQTTTLVPAFEEPSDVPGADGALPLDRSSTVVASGGGRGVTAQVVRMMAAEVPCRYVLLGSTPLLEVQAALGIGGRETLLNLSIEELEEHKRRQFAAMRRQDGSLLPPAFERHWSRITNSLEVMRTLTHLRDLGARAEYVCLDITDTYRTRQFCDETLSVSGPIQALLHGAGVETSRALCDKTQESWERTAAVKIGGLYNLSPLLGEQTRLIMLFGSAAGTFGNPGQIDYAGANEFLSTAAHRLAVDFPAARVRSVAWPAWDEIGMAVRPSSRAALEQRSIEFMKPSEGLAWAGALMRSPSQTPVCLTLGYRGMPEQIVSNRTIAPWNAAQGNRGRLVDTCHESGPQRWDLRWTYQPELDAALADHQVDGKVRVPLAFFVELLCQSVAACLGDVRGLIVRDLRVLQALTLAPERRREVRVNVERTSPGTLAVRIASTPVLPDGTWLPISIEHVSAKVELATEPLPDTRMETVPADAEPVLVDRHLEQFAANGIVYGPAFREVVTCRRIGTRHHVELQAVPEWNEDIRGRSFFNIGLLDLALQTLRFHPGAERGGLPTAIGELVVHARLGDAQAAGRALVEAAAERLDVTLADPAGRVLLEIRDLVLTHR